MKRYLIKCLPFVKRIETKWKRGKKKRKKSRKRGKTRCSDGGWNTIARFVKNSCATGHLLSWREMKVHEIITPGWWWRMIEIVIENIFFPHSIYIYFSSRFLSIWFISFSSVAMWRETAGETLSLSDARTTVIDVKRACGSLEKIGS